MPSGAKIAIAPGKNVGDSKSLPILIAIVWFGLLLVHANKSIGFFPLVIPDEYWYLSDLRHRSFAEMQFPGYIYYLVYSLVNYFGQRFLDAGRILNACIFMLSAPFLYNLSRLVCGKNTSLFIVLLILISPISSYTAYFMPESFYFTAFWAMAWLMLRYASLSPMRAGCLAGMGIAVLSLIKAHGMFLVPGYVLFVLATTPRTTRSAYGKNALAALIAAGASFLALRLGIGLLLAGQSGLNIFGSSYRTVLLSDEALRVSMPLAVSHILYSFMGHFAAVMLLFALPIAMAASLLLGGNASGESAPLRRMALFAFCFLLPLVAITLCFSGYVAALKPDMDIPEFKSINWRYYNFLFPVFPMITAGILAKNTVRLPRPLAYGAVFSVIAAAMLLVVFQGYQVFAIPACPELGGLTHNGVFFALGILCLVGVAILILFDAFLAARAYLYVVLPLVLVMATIGTHMQSIHAFGVFPDIYDKGGMFAREYLKEKCADLTVVDSFYNTMTKALIHIDNPQTDMLPQFTQELDMTQIKPGKKWLLVFGGIRIPARYVASSIVYDDPAQTPDLTNLMRERNDFRSMVRYTLVELKQEPRTSPQVNR